MFVYQIVAGVNTKLAGETLTFNQMRLFLSEVIDDINTQLNAKFPSFDDLTENSEYNYFPDKYIRSVVITGAAYKFYVTDEEGIVTATQYQQDYMTNLFYMLRDYSNKIPEEYQETDQGYVKGIDFNQPIESAWRGWY